MSKFPIYQAPKFSLENLPDMKKFFELSEKYNSTDNKGRYLPWDKLKWRLDTEKDSEKKEIWTVIKYKRETSKTSIDLKCSNDKAFSYVRHDQMDSKIYEISKEFGGSIATIGGEKTSKNIENRFLVSSLIIEEAITSSQLEGASTTREKAKEMLINNNEPKDDDEQMILNNYFLMQYAENTASEELTIDSILEFHKIATYKSKENNVIPGTFRKDNEIDVRDFEDNIVHTPPDYKNIELRMKKLCDFINKKHDGKGGNIFIPDIIKAIIIHFMVGYEHPFRDGNGRTARAIFYWFLIKNGYSIFKYVSISKLLKKDPIGYGKSYLYTEDDDNDLTYFIDYQLEIIIKSLNELYEYLQKKTQEFEEIENLLIKKDTDFVFIQKDIIKQAAKDPGKIFKIKGQAKTYGISENTARKHLNKLAEKRLLIKTKDGKEYLYISPSDLRDRIKSL